MNYFPRSTKKAGRFNEGYARVKLFDLIKQDEIGRILSREEEEWTYIDRQGQERLPPRYNEISDFSEGYAPVRIGNKWTSINPQGQELFPPRYGSLYPFQNGFVLTYDAVLWRFIDKGGKEIFALDADEALLPSEGFAPVKIEGKWTYLKVPENAGVKPTPATGINESANSLVTDFSGIKRISLPTSMEPIPSLIISSPIFIED